MNQNLFIAPHQGLGDHLICVGLYRRLALEYDRIIIPVRLRYRKDLCRVSMLSPNISLIVFPDSVFEECTKAQCQFSERVGEAVLRLGYYEKEYLTKHNLKFDEAFYAQAGFDFELRWSNFLYKRDLRREHNILHKYKLAKDEEFTLIHHDPSRDFIIDSSKIKGKGKILEIKKFRGYTIFDYRELIERAAELHFIESSFSVFADNIGVINTNKYIHRYSRPEALNDTRHEASYRSKWKFFV